MIIYCDTMVNLKKEYQRKDEYKEFNKLIKEVVELNNKNDTTVSFNRDKEHYMDFL